MVFQAYKAQVKTLGIIGVVAVNVRVYRVKDSKAGKAFHAQHKGRAAFVRHHQHIGRAVCQLTKLAPAKRCGLFKIVKAQIPAAFGQRFGEKGAAYPKKLVHYKSGPWV